MKYKCYKIILLSIFALLGLLFLSQKYLMQNEWISKQIFINTFYFYTPTVLSLSALYISFYAYLRKVEPSKKYGRPITAFCLVCAFLCLTFSLTPPILGYLSLANIKINHEIHEVRENSTELDSNSGDRLINKHEARLHYRKTKELTEYVDEDGKKVLYSPDKTDELFFENIHNRELLQKSVKSIRSSVVILVVITIASFFGFLLFLRYTGEQKRRSGQYNRGHKIIS